MSIRKEDFISKYGVEAWEIEAQKRREYKKKYRNTHQDTIRNYRQTHRDEFNGYSKKYRETHIEKVKEKEKKYRDNHKDAIKERMKNWSEKNPDYYKDYQHTQKHRANRLLFNYKRDDEKRREEKCTLTKNYILNHIFTSSCVYCGDSDWEHLGCDRIDDNLPHTPENCVCSCGICNIERQNMRMSVDEFKEYRKIHPRELNTTKYHKMNIVEVDGLKVIKKTIF